MRESSWSRRAGPGIAAIGALAFVASTTLGAPVSAWEPGSCEGPPGATHDTGAWYRLDPVIEAGVRAGSQVTIGGGRTRAPRTLSLDPEAFAAGPFHGGILLGSDDGDATALRLIDVERGCAWDIGTTTDAVVRRATLTADRSSLIEFRVDRRTRADLGVWRRPLGGGAATRVLPPIAPDARFGRTWATELAWADDGSLVVASCGETACRYRVAIVDGGSVGSIADTRLGQLVGMADGRLVAHGACRGFPCPLLAVDVARGTVVILHPAAGAAVLAHDAHGRPTVVHEVGGHGDLRSVDLAGHELGRIDVDPGGGRLVAPPWRTDSGAATPPGGLLLSSDGRVPTGGPHDGRSSREIQSFLAGETTP